MNQYHDTEVIINNKRYTLAGYESEEYLQRVASYINGKHNEFKNRDAYKFIDTDMRSILIQINIADDYHKAKDKIKEIEVDSESKSKEIFDLKHELISVQTKLNTANKEIEELQKELNETQKKVFRLETELDDTDKIG
ncbi:MAG TPA: cell division protein ZapA [Clostridiales bacterium]|nr:cell division protein ZapA [Clostridiales bacterium]